MIKDLIKYSISNLWDRKMRTFLSILSILIGITSIFALASFGLGVKFFVDDFSKQMGTDKIMVLPKNYVTTMGEGDVFFTEEDVEFMEKINGVDEAAGMLISNAKVEFKDFREKYVFAMSISTEPRKQQLIGELFGVVTVEEGRTLKKGDFDKAVLGYNYQIPNRIFKKGLSTGDKIKVNDAELEVIGFYGEIGNPGDDANIYLTEERMTEIFDQEDYFYVIIRTSPGEDPSLIADKITDKFRKRKDQKEGQEDFFAQTFEQVMEIYSNILNVIVGILVMIALISVVVAAVNITNTMYTSIIERTKEIGVMKSIGSRNRYILLIFIIESGLLGFIGGVFGIFFGYLIASFGGYMAEMNALAMLQPIFPWWLIVGCLLFSTLVGIGSGFLPSRQASKLKPVDALRYE
ncbi:ABC transporter permease [Nanoarchaeota archaeon]